MDVVSALLSVRWAIFGFRMGERYTVTTAPPVMRAFTGVRRMQSGLMRWQCGIVRNIIIRILLYKKWQEMVIAEFVSNPTGTKSIPVEDGICLWQDDITLPCCGAIVSIADSAAA